jgi:hypothetical protein
MKLKPRGRRYITKTLLPDLELELLHLRVVYNFFENFPPDASWSENYVATVYMRTLHRCLAAYQQEQQRARYFIARLDARDPLCERLVDLVSAIEAEWEWFSLN